MEITEQQEVGQIFIGLLNHLAYFFYFFLSSWICFFFLKSYTKVFCCMNVNPLTKWQFDQTFEPNRACAVVAGGGLQNWYLVFGYLAVLWAEHAHLLQKRRNSQCQSVLHLSLRVWMFVRYVRRTIRELNNGWMWPQTFPPGITRVAWTATVL